MLEQTRLPHPSVPTNERRPAAYACARAAWPFTRPLHLSHTSSSLCTRHSAATEPSAEPRPTSCDGLRPLAAHRFPPCMYLSLSLRAGDCVASARRGLPLGRKIYLLLTAAHRSRSSAVALGSVASSSARSARAPASPLSSPPRRSFSSRAPRRARIAALALRCAERRIRLASGASCPSSSSSHSGTSRCCCCCCCCCWHCCC